MLPMQQSCQATERMDPASEFGKILKLSGTVLLEDPNRYQKVFSCYYILFLFFQAAFSLARILACKPLEQQTFDTVANSACFEKHCVVTASLQCAKLPYFCLFVRTLQMNKAVYSYFNDRTKTQRCMEQNHTL